MESEEESQWKSFTYTITDPAGIHARPAGLFGQDRRWLQVDLQGGRQWKDRRPLNASFTVMGLGIKAGMTITVYG